VITGETVFMDKQELKVGTYVELEHYGEERDMKGAAKIAMDHLKEDPKYYSKLWQAGLIDEPKAIELAKKYFGDNKQYYMESAVDLQKQLDNLKKNPNYDAKKARELHTKLKAAKRKEKTGTSKYVRRRGPNTGKPIGESLLHTAVKELLSEYEWGKSSEYEFGQTADWWKGQLAAEATDHLEEPAIVFDKKTKHYFLASVDTRNKTILELHPQSKSKKASDICKLNWIKLYKQIHETDGQWRVNDYKWVANPIQSCKR
jgi:hypothetical protein